MEAFDEGVGSGEQRRKLLAACVVGAVLGGLFFAQCVIVAGGGTPVVEDRIDVNAADAESLVRLPGIGPSKAEAIVEYREEARKFERVEDMEDVKGIGPKTVEKLRPFLRFDENAN
ncbi:ComE operon protein 1 [Anaerohalosphaera lusitana]|uniref:ComE operon protein 1 n=1 Tax=Anaerohalosphaera lusitana TaxID=1936003 RepID=A0A1U9NL85_9BACT|nr:ComEA family DNA-binding protein [Anaerohalosphaera lusitana]AQT68669.1 ComE operon protein 1 [Anaerohalosphaera lusitana]